MENPDRALAIWWRDACKDFSLYFLTKSTQEQRALLITCCPAMPEVPAHIREERGEELTATDMILPELQLEGLLSKDGRGLIMMMLKRLASADVGLEADIALLRMLHANGQMPVFSNGALAKYNTPFVDPLDPEYNIRALPAAASNAQIMETHRLMAEGKLVHAEVWLTCTIRRKALSDFLMCLKTDFEEHQCPKRAAGAESDLADKVKEKVQPSRSEL